MIQAEIHGKYVYTQTFTFKISWTTCLGG